MTRYSMTIGGKGVEADGQLDVVDPATGQVTATAPAGSAAQLDEAVDSARAALPGWSDDETGRRELLASAAEVIEEAASELAEVLTAEQGKPLKQAGYEFTAAAAWFRYYAALRLDREVVQDDEQRRVELHRKPLGVVAAITPWNYPILLASWKLAPALAAGNTIVLKPSPYTPLATLRLGELLRGVLPAGVLNVVSGDDALGAALVAHPVPRKVSFTGSVAAGKQVGASAALGLKRTTLELGGNDAAIVLDDVAPHDVAKRLFWGAMQNTGQTCSAIKRLYVPTARVRGFFDALADYGRSVRVGVGTDPASQLGPISNAPQHKRVTELLDDAVAHGACLDRGQSPTDGYFHPVNMVRDVDDGVRIVDEEQFGPVLPIVGYDTVDQAVERANGSAFGLSGSVWSADEDRATAIAARLECGTVWINSHLVLAPHVPFGGVKDSGIGLENGHWGLREFTRPQVVSVPRRP